MKYFLIVLTIIIHSSNVIAQPAEDSVKAVIKKMFAAMKNADAAALKSCFADSMILQTIAINMEGNLIIRNENPADLLIL